MSPYRRGVSGEPHLEKVNGSAGEVCGDFGAVLERMWRADHVHMLGRIPTNCATVKNRLTTWKPSQRAARNGSGICGSVRSASSLVTSLLVAQWWSAAGSRKALHSVPAQLDATQLYRDNPNSPPPATVDALNEKMVGRSVVAVAKFPSSKRYSGCVYTMTTNRADVRSWICPECGLAVGSVTWMRRRI